MILKYLGTALGITKETKSFWHYRIKERLVKQFEYGLTKEELDKEYNLSKAIQIDTLLKVEYLALFHISKLTPKFSEYVTWWVCK